MDKPDAYGTGTPTGTGFWIGTGFGTGMYLAWRKGTNVINPIGSFANSQAVSFRFGTYHRNYLLNGLVHRYFNLKRKEELV